MPLAIAQDVVVTQDSRDMEPADWRRTSEVAVAGEVGWVVGFQGIDKAVIRFHDGKVMSLLMAVLRPVHDRGRRK